MVYNVQVSVKGGIKMNIERVYELMYSPLISPLKLVQNAKLENYDYVNFHTEGEFLMCEMKCSVDGVKMTFMYRFDKNDHLVDIKRIDTPQIEVMFDRELELIDAKNQFLGESKKKLQQLKFAL